MKRRRKTTAKFKEPDQSANATSDFSFSITRVAVSQTCRSVGYTSADSSALNSLTLIATKFLQSLAGLAASFANTANRTEVNVFDIVNGLENISLSTSDYFPGGSTLHDAESRCLIKSAALRNISDFVAYASEIPFAKPLPKRENDGSSGGDRARVRHAPSLQVNSVPAWLPPFPDRSLYLENSTKDRSDHLWENSDSVNDVETLPERSKTESRGGSLPQRRGRVRFKVERNWIGKSGGSFTSGRRFERWRDDNERRIWP
ncbi:unnamed protein product [Cochlearia groenlandica]